MSTLMTQLESEGPELLLKGVQDIVRGERGKQMVWDLYRFAFPSAWNRMTTMLGLNAAMAVMGHVLRDVSTRFPADRFVRLADESLDLTGLSQLSPEMESQETERCLEELYLAVIRTLCELTGAVLVGPLLEELRKWEAEHQDFARAQ